MNKISRQQLNQEINDKLNSIGNKSNLNTNYKDNLVGAINEVNNKINNHTHDASDITSGIFDVARIPDLEGSKIISSVNHAENADKIGGMTVEQIIQEVTINNSLFCKASNNVKIHFPEEKILTGWNNNGIGWRVYRFIFLKTGSIRISFDMKTEYADHSHNRYPYFLIYRHILSDYTLSENDERTMTRRAGGTSRITNTEYSTFSFIMNIVAGDMIEITGNAGVAVVDDEEVDNKVYIKDFKISYDLINDDYVVF